MPQIRVEWIAGGIEPPISQFACKLDDGGFLDVGSIIFFGRSFSLGRCQLFSCSLLAIELRF
ncbi:MAG: hypothetical protein ACLQVJ_14790 [Syntrophobacteraceae bacterium]